MGPSERVPSFVLECCLHDNREKFDMKVAVVRPDYVHMIVTPLVNWQAMEVYPLGSQSEQGAGPTWSAADGRPNHDFVVIRRGLLVFVAFAPWDNLAGVFSLTSRKVEPFSFAGFLGALGYVAARRTLQRRRMISPLLCATTRGQCPSRRSSRTSLARDQTCSSHATGWTRH